MDPNDSDVIRCYSGGFRHRSEPTHRIYDVTFDRAVTGIDIGTPQHIADLFLDQLNEISR